MPSIAGCLEDEKPNMITANDIVISPEVMIAGEFQPLVITAKKDMSVFIPNLVIDPLSNYVQNGTVLDMKAGDTKQLISLAPPRIDTAFIFLAKYSTENWPIRNPNESWDQWVKRNGMKEGGMSVSRIEVKE